MQASARDELAGGQVVLVVSDHAGSGALERARRHRIEGLFLNPALYRDRGAYDRALAQLCQERDIGLVCLAGFMRILSSPFIRAFEGRILNTHPALLPAFPGAHAVRDALAWGVKVTGVTVHFADEQVDHGPIVMQEPVKVLQDDDEARLHERIKSVEHRLFAQAVRAVISEGTRIVGRIVLSPDGARAPTGRAGGPHP